MRKIEQIQDIDNKEESILKKELYRKLSGINLEDIFIENISKNKEIVKIEDYSNLGFLEDFILKNNVKNKDKKLKDLRSLEKEIIEDFLEDFHKIKEYKLEHNTVVERILFFMFTNNVYNRDLMEKKEYINFFKKILYDIDNNLPAYRKFFLAFMEVLRKYSKKLPKEMFQDLNIDKNEFVKKIKRSICDVNGIDLIVKEGEEYEFVDLKSSGSINLVIEEYSDMKKDKKGWLENELIDKLIIGNFRETNNKELNKLKVLFDRLKKGEDTITLIKEYNEIVENIDLTKVEIKKAEFNLEFIRKSKEKQDKLKEIIIEDLDNDLLNEDNEFYSIYTRDKRENEELSKSKYFCKEDYEHDFDLINNAEKLIYVYNKSLNKKICVGVIIEGQKKLLKEINITDSTYQSKFSGHEQNNISKAFKIFDIDKVEKFNEKFNGSVRKKVERNIQTKGGLKIKKRVR